MAGILGNVWVLGLLCALAWGFTVYLTLHRPHLFFNSLLLLFSLGSTALFVGSFFQGEARRIFLLSCFGALALFLFLFPVFLIISGIRMLQREAIVFRHFLALGAGIGIGIAEAAAVVYVLNLSGIIHIGNMAPWLQFFVLTAMYLIGLLLAFILYLIFLQILPHRMCFQYVVIHGCGLSGGERLTRLLRDRVEKAIEIYTKCENPPVIIPSGGQGKDEKLSEAQAMKNYLLERGIPEDHIILEDRSSSTSENLRFSKAIIDSAGGGKMTALVSSSFHIYRCLRLAYKEGLRCVGFGSYTALYFLPSALIREFIAIFISKEFLPWAVIGYICWIAPFLIPALSNLL